MKQTKHEGTYKVTYIRKGEYIRKDVEGDKLSEALLKLEKAQKDKQITEFYYWRIYERQNQST